MKPFAMMLEARVVYEALTTCTDDEAADEISKWGNDIGIQAFQVLTPLQQAAILLAAARRIQDNANMKRRIDETTSH